MDAFVKHYLVTALWSSSDSDGTPFDSEHEVENINSDSIQQAKIDCDSFREKAGNLLDEYDETTVGHDFWLTRNGHGAGFWDGDYEKVVGEKLTELSKEFREVNMYKGDNGEIYIS